MEFNDALKECKKGKAIGDFYIRALNLTQNTNSYYNSSASYNYDKLN